MKKLRLTVAAGAAAAALFVTSSVAFGEEAFLCPIVGDGVVNADSHNGDNGVENIGPLPGSGGASFLPGNNQAGANSNTTAHNPEGPGTSPGPGDGNSDWSPIWPGS